MNPAPSQNLNRFSKLLLLTFLAFSRLLCYSQQKVELSGIIYDSLSGETLVGVNVYCSDLGIGTVSDSRGAYQLLLSSGTHTVEYSYIGYATKQTQIDVSKHQQLDVFLKTSDTQLQEIKIVAQRKFFGNMDYGRAIPSIESKVIEQQSVNNASDILHGRIAGVWATKTSGAPGDHQKIRIRGQNSFFSSAEPLYVVDGVPVPIVNMSSLGIADLNIHDIENVSVLRDASSSSLYGFQGGNGVVLIDTKKGGGKPVYTFISKQGTHWQGNYYDMMNTDDFLTSFDSAYSIIGSPIRKMYPASSGDLCSENWQKEIFSPGYSQEYHLSASGSVNSYNYYLSGNYYNHSGTLPDSRYIRKTISSRVSRSFFNKLVIDLGYRASWQKNQNNQDEYKGNRLIFEGISKAPCIQCTPDSLLYTEEGYLRSRTFYYPYISLSNPELPDKIAADNRHSLSIVSHHLNLAARFQINNYFHMDLMESFMNRPSKYQSNFKSSSYTSAGFGTKVLKSDENVVLFNHQVKVSYNQNFKKNHVGVLVAHRFYKDNLWWEVDSFQGALLQQYTLKNSMAAYDLNGSVTRTMNSFISHVSYNYNQIWFLSGIANLSHVKEGLYTNYYTLFPSVALSWDILRQIKIENSRILNNLLLYLNWGQSGNYPLNGLANDMVGYLPYSNGYTANYFPTVSQLANHNFRHENTTETDLGLRSSLLNNRFSVDAVYYTKYMSDLVLLRDIPDYYGGGKQHLNFGAVAIQGYEVGLEIVPVSRPLFDWQIMFNYSQSIQKVDRLLENQELSFIDQDILIPDFIIRQDDPLGNIYGYKYLGKMQAADWDTEHNSFVIIHNEKYLNADSSDMELNSNDKIVLGNSTPDFTLNLSTTLRYKNFSFNMVWYGVGGVDKYNATRAAGYMKGVDRAINPFIADSLRSITTNYFYESNLFVEDASFIRLKTASLNYSMYHVFTERMNLHVSFSINNILTITPYSGYDPEASIYTDNNFSDNAIDRGAYPSPKSFFVSLKFEFQ